MVIIREGKSVVTTAMKLKIKSAQEEVNSLVEFIDEQFRWGTIDKDLQDRLRAPAMEALKALSKTASIR